MPALREIFAEYDIAFDRQRTLQRGNRQVSSLRSTLQRLTPAVRTAAGALAGIGAAVGGGAVAGLQQIVSSTIESTREIERWSGRLQISSGALRSWIELGREYGADIDDVTDALKEMQLKAQDALSGGTAQAEMFERIGISLDDLRPVVNDTDRLMQLFTSRLDRVSDAGLRNFTVDEIMSDAGTRLNEVFALGSDEIQRRRAAITSSIGPTDELTRSVVDHARVATRMRRNWERLQRQITARVLPVFDRVMRALESMRPQFMRIVDVISDVVQHTNILKGVLVGLGVAGAVAAAATIGAWGPIAAAMAGIVVAVAMVAVAYDQVTRTIAGSSTALSRFLDSAELLGPDGTQGLILLLGDAWDRLTGRIAAGAEAVDGFLESLQPVLAVLDRIYQGVEFISGGFVNQIFGGSLGSRIMPSLREATQERAAEERTRTARGLDTAAARRGESRENQRQSTYDVLTDHENRTGIDIAGHPISIPERDGGPVVPTPVPSIPRSAGISDRVSRESAARQQNISVSAPSEMIFNISEATDIDQVRRIIERSGQEREQRLAATIESMISDRTEVGS